MFQPLSDWLNGEEIFGGEIDSIEDLADALGVTKARLMSIRSSKAFRKFHLVQGDRLTELALRRQSILNNLYELASAGSLEAAKAFLSHTKDADQILLNNQKTQDGLSLEEALEITDQQLHAMIESERK